MSLANLSNCEIKVAHYLQISNYFEALTISFEYPNKDGLYPLVAAVYGTNLELVRYVEGKLKEEASKQWSEVDVNKALESLTSQMPTDLPNNAKSGDIVNWRLKHNGSKWFKRYDEYAIISKSSGLEIIIFYFLTVFYTYTIYEKLGWSMGNWNNFCMNLFIPFISIITDKYKGGGLYSPNIELHDNVVKNIRDELNELRKDVETKIKQEKNRAFCIMGQKISLFSIKNENNWGRLENKEISLNVFRFFDNETLKNAACVSTSYYELKHIVEKEKEHEETKGFGL